MTAFIHYLSIYKTRFLNHKTIFTSTRSKKRQNQAWSYKKSVNQRASRRLYRDDFVPALRIHGKFEGPIL